jgi:hypothetical protein
MSRRESDDVIISVAAEEGEATERDEFILQMRPLETNESADAEEEKPQQPPRAETGALRAHLAELNRRRRQREEDGLATIERGRQRVYTRRRHDRQPSPQPQPQPPSAAAQQQQQQQQQQHMPWWMKGNHSQVCLSLFLVVLTCANLAMLALNSSDSRTLLQHYVNVTTPAVEEPCCVCDCRP